MNSEIAEKDFQDEWFAVYQDDLDLLKEHIQAKKDFELYKSRCQIAKKRMIKTWNKLSKKYMDKCLNPKLFTEEELEENDRQSYLEYQQSMCDQKSQ